MHDTVKAGDGTAAMMIAVGGMHGDNFGMATPAGLEPATPCLEGRCSIQLSYGVRCRDNTE